jgi:hypothetical protein
MTEPAPSPNAARLEQHARTLLLLLRREQLAPRSYESSAAASERARIWELGRTILPAPKRITIPAGNWLFSVGQPDPRVMSSGPFPETPEREDL